MGFSTIVERNSFHDKCIIPISGAQLAQLTTVIESKTGDGGGILSDELLEAMEHQTSDTEADCHISLYVI
jgi:hypothetical protein